MPGWLERLVRLIDFGRNDREPHRIQPWKAFAKIKGYEPEDLSYIYNYLEETYGLSSEIVQICATMSYEVYHKTDEAGFAAPGKTSLQTTLDKENGARPPAVRTIFKLEEDIFSDISTKRKKEESTTMVIAWRGSVTLSNWWLNATAYLTKSNIWSEDLEIHGGFFDAVRVYFEAFEKDIIHDIKKFKVKKLLFTGHSLGGAVAQVAHAAVLAKLDMSAAVSEWGSLDKNLECQCLVFAAPIPFAPLPAEVNQEARPLFNKLKRTSYNLVIQQDIVPMLPKKLLPIYNFFHQDEGYTFLREVAGFSRAFALKTVLRYARDTLDNTLSKIDEETSRYEHTSTLVACDIENNAFANQSIVSTTNLNLEAILEHHAYFPARLAYIPFRGVFDKIQTKYPVQMLFDFFSELSSEDQESVIKKEDEDPPLYWQFHGKKDKPSRYGAWFSESEPNCVIVHHNWATQTYYDNTNGLEVESKFEVMYIQGDDHLHLLETNKAPLKFIELDTKGRDPNRRDLAEPKKTWTDDRFKYTQYEYIYASEKLEPEIEENDVP